MSNSLKECLDKDFPGKLDITVVPVDSNGPRGKVYTISINGESYFDFQLANNQPPPIVKASNESWKTPLNFETHEKFFGPGKGQPGGEAKDQMYEDLKAAVGAKVSA